MGNDLTRALTLRFLDTDIDVVERFENLDLDEAFNEDLRRAHDEEYRLACLLEEKKEHARKREKILAKEEARADRRARLREREWSEARRAEESRRRRERSEFLAFKKTLPKKEQRNRMADDVYFALRKLLDKEGKAGKSVPVALTSLGVDLLSSRCNIARHVIGAPPIAYVCRWNPQWGAVWSAMKPPPGRGRYILRIHDEEEIAVSGSSTPKDMVYYSQSSNCFVRVTTKMDDPDRTFPWDQEHPPPPLYPCTTQREIGLRNILGRPTLTFGRSRNGVLYAQRCRDAADRRSELRAKYAIKKSIGTFEKEV